MYCVLGRFVQWCSRIPTTLRDMSAQEVTCYETETCTFEPHKSSSIHSFNYHTPPSRNQARLKTSRCLNSSPSYMSESPIASPVALALAVSDNYDAMLFFLIPYSWHR